MLWAKTPIDLTILATLTSASFSRALLKDVYAGKKRYDELPSLYVSFVPRQLIDFVRAKYGRYFLRLAPDIASGLINPATSETHIYSYRPLGVRGVSHHSTFIVQTCANSLLLEGLIGGAERKNGWQLAGDPSHG